MRTDEATGSALEAGPFAVVVESEVEQPSEVDGGDAQRETSWLLSTPC